MQRAQCFLGSKSMKLMLCASDMSAPLNTQPLGTPFDRFKSQKFLDAHCCIRTMVMFVFVSSFLQAFGQCANFGAFNIGDDVEISCTDSCLTLFSPNIASVAASGSDYEVDEIDYELPYPFNQGAAAISTGDDDFAAATNVPLGFTFNFYGNDYTHCWVPRFNLIFLVHTTRC